MKTKSEFIHYGSKQDYLKRAGKPVKGSDANSILKNGLDTTAPVKSQALDKVELSDKAKQLSKGKTPQQKVESKIKESGKVGKHLLGEAAVTLKRAFEKTPGLSSLPFPGREEDTATKLDRLAAAGKQVQVDAPGIFFVTGFSLNPFDNDEFGLTGMAQNIPGAQKMNWDDGDDLITEIKRRPHNQPIILVGHGMGGDALVDVANKLNTVEHGFRSVDLLVTLDSIGFENDIIPQNVVENLNIISDEDMFFNDGPNVARNKKLTKVINELRTESHSELDESPEVQFQVFDKINSVLNGFVAKKKLAEALSHTTPAPGINKTQS